MPGALLPDAASLAAVLPVGVCLVGPDGIVLFANPAFYEVFDAAPDSVRPGTALDELRERDPFRHAGKLWRDRLGEPGRRHRCALPSGRVVEGAWQTVPTTGVRAVTVTDATSEALIRRRLRQHNRTLAELLATKTELVSALLHEVRTPLTAARSMAGLLPREYDDPLAEEAFRALERNLRRLEAVTGEIATISGIENGTLELAFDPVRMDELIAGLNLPIKVGPIMVGDAAPTTVLGDARRLGEVLERLLTAVRATGGTSAEAGRRDGQWRLSLPLPPEVTADRLFTTTGTHGNATALMFARAVIARHGGTVGIESEDGTACLTVRLPLSEPRPEPDLEG
jgi:signal transduction histidine kinase